MQYEQERVKNIAISNSYRESNKENKLWTNEHKQFIKEGKRRKLLLSAIAIERAIQIISYEPMYINNFKKEAKRLRATTWEDKEYYHNIGRINNFIKH